MPVRMRPPRLEPRVSTKLCPNCSADVPAIANLCKHCFHDFHVVVPKKKSPLWTLLFLAVGTSFVAAAVFAHIYGTNKVMNIAIDKGTKSIVFTTKYPDHTEAERVLWKDIAFIEYLKGASPAPYQVWVVTTSGERFEFSEGNEPQDAESRRLAESIGKSPDSIIVKDSYAGAQGRE